MSDLTARTRCNHGNLWKHAVYFTTTGDIEWCPGGKEIVLRQVANVTLEPHDDVKVIEFTEPTVYVLVEEA